jgi:hypothetical protein
MQILEAEFTDAATPEIREYLSELILNAKSLDDIFDGWFLERGHTFGLSFAAEDELGKDILDDRFVIYFDTADGKAILYAYIPRTELMEAYPGVPSLDTFLKGWRKEGQILELDKSEYDQWLEGLGFKMSYALMGQMGPRSGALKLMVAFALSNRGIVETRHLEPNDPLYEDSQEEIDEEGIDLADYFWITGGYRGPHKKGMINQTMFDPFYGRKFA